MQVPGKKYILFTLLAGLCLTTACNRGDPTPTAPLGEKERYVLATVDLICLGHEEADPKILRQNTRTIYQHYGFEHPMRYLSLVSSLERDEAIQGQIQQGIKQCPK